MQNIYSAIDTCKTRGLGTLCRAVYHLTRSHIHTRLFGSTLIKCPVNQYQMYVDIKDKGISRSLILFGTREVDHKIILEDVLKEGMTIFDIGANIGYYVIMERRSIGSKGKIIAIEPSPTNVALLQRNIALNGFDKDGTIEVVEGGVSDKAGSFPFYLAEQSNLNTFHKDGSAAAHLTGKTIDVRTYAMPELVEKHGAPDLIRMDVEGHELEIISGMLKDMKKRKYRPMICFEPHLSCYTKDHDFVPVLKELFKLGYETRYLSSNAQSGTKRITSLGYQAERVVPSDGEFKSIFSNISAEDTITILTQLGGARTVLLVPKSE